MSELTQVGFDYAALPVDSADRLQTIKRDIAIIDTLACVQIGQKLKEAQAELNMRGKSGSGFQEWVESETPYALTAAYEMIRIATRFGGENDMRISAHHFSFSVLARLSAPSTPESVIDKAVAKAESGEKVTVADVRDWKALEAELEIEKRRNREWMEQNKANRDKIRALELDLSAALDRPVPKPEIQVIEKIPADYETSKARAMELAQDLATLKKKQADLVQQQVTAKLREREKEITDLDRQAKEAESLLDSLNKKISSYSSLERMTRLQRDLIEKTRSALVDLASHLEGLTPLETDPETDRLWDALADMLHNGALAIEQFLGRAKPALTVIRGSTA